MIQPVNLGFATATTGAVATVVEVGASVVVGDVVVVVSKPPDPITTLNAAMVSARPALSVSSTLKGAAGMSKALWVAQQFAMASVIPSAAPAGVTVKGLVTAAAVSPPSGTKL